MNHIEQKNNLILRNLDRFKKYYPSIEELAVFSNMRQEFEEEMI